MLDGDPEAEASEATWSPIHVGGLELTVPCCLLSCLEECGGAQCVSTKPRVARSVVWTAADVDCSAACAVFLVTGLSPVGGSSRCIQCIILRLPLAVVGLAVVADGALVIVLYRVSKLIVRCEAQMTRRFVGVGCLRGAWIRSQESACSEVSCHNRRFPSSRGSKRWLCAGLSKGRFRGRWPLWRHDRADLDGHFPTTRASNDCTIHCQIQTQEGPLSCSQLLRKVDQACECYTDPMRASWNVHPTGSCVQTCPSLSVSMFCSFGVERLVSRHIDTCRQSSDILNISIDGWKVMRGRDCRMMNAYTKFSLHEATALAILSTLLSNLPDINAGSTPFTSFATFIFDHIVWFEAFGWFETRARQLWERLIKEY